MQKQNLILGKEGKNLVKLYQEKLQISSEEAIKIIMKNKTAQSILKKELVLSVTGTQKNLSALMSATILKDFYDFESIRESEKELIKVYYDI